MWRDAVQPTRVLVLAIVVAFCLSGERSSASGCGDVRELVHREGQIWDPDELSAFGVNGTRLRWHDIEKPPSTLDISATTHAVTSRWPAGLAFSAGRTASRSEGGGLSRYNALGVVKGRRGAKLESSRCPTKGLAGI